MPNRRIPPYTILHASQKYPSHSAINLPFSPSNSISAQSETDKQTDEITQKTLIRANQRQTFSLIYLASKTVDRTHR